MECAVFPYRLKEIADLNLAEFHRETIRAVNGDISEHNGMLMFASSLKQATPAMVNGAIPLHRTLDPRHALLATIRFFATRRHGFTLILRETDQDLEKASIDSGLKLTHQEPAMILKKRPIPSPLPDSCEIRQVVDSLDVLAFHRIAVTGHASNKIARKAVDLLLSRQQALIGVNKAAFVAYKEGSPASCAMTLVSHGAAFIGWVATDPNYRKHGLGTAVTLAAIEAGFAMGAQVASLQTSAMARSIYERIGFIEIGRYREYTAESKVLVDHEKN